MAGRINLNSLYKAINKALDIQSDKQLTLFQGAGSNISRSMVNGFWRREDDNRYKHVTPTLLNEYCFALKRSQDLTTLKGQQDLTEVDNVWASAWSTPEAACLQFRAQLMINIRQIIKNNGWDTIQAAKEFCVGINDVEAIINGQLSNFTTDQLLGVLGSTDYEVETIIKKRPPKAPTTKSQKDLIDPILQEVIETLRNQEQINLEEMIDRIESHET